MDMLHGCLLIFLFILFMFNALILKLIICLIRIKVNWRSSTLSVVIFLGILSLPCYCPLQGVIMWHIVSFSCPFRQFSLATVTTALSIKNIYIYE